MQLYAWVTPAFISKGSPVDHTWVTSYDSRKNQLSSISGIINAREHYWYCRGSFHKQGQPYAPIVTAIPSSGAATCLVDSNNAKSSGTVHWYGIDGVCHQVSNQVLYVTSTPAGGKPRIVSAARGYKLSSALFNTYGRREAEWDAVRLKCGVAPNSIHARNWRISLLRKRMAYTLNLSLRDLHVLRLEQSRRELLANLDDIGFATRELNETIESRVYKMNERINSFLHFASEEFDDKMGFTNIFGVSPGEEISLIDPSLFEFPNPSDRPERGLAAGW